MTERYFWAWDDKNLARMNRRRIIKGRVSRDGILDILAVIRADLIRQASDIAVSLAQHRGRVTSTEVLYVMRRDRETAIKMGCVDTRWVGAVFRKGWRRLGFERTGSHARPVSVWTLDNGDQQ